MNVFDGISCQVAHQLGTADCSQKQENRFAATNHVDESVTSTEKFIEIFVVDREKLVHLELQTDST